MTDPIIVNGKRRIFRVKKRPPEPPNSDTCPDCGKVHPDSALNGCNTVKGRRGWRQLGVYDG